jgi:hypothetical protein
MPKSGWRSRVVWRSPIWILGFPIGWALSWAIGWNDWPPNRHDFVLFGVPVTLSLVRDLARYRRMKRLLTRRSSRSANKGSYPPTFAILDG